MAIGFWTRRRRQEPPGGLDRRIADLEARQRALDDGFPLAKVDAAIRALGQRVQNGNPNMVYMNERFRDYELALLNVKQLGYDIARQLALTNLQRRIEAPADAQLTSSLCTQRDIESDWFGWWCQEMKVAPIYHRKLWELCFIAQTLRTGGKLTSGMSGLGFGCGQEVLPSLFAKYGVAVLATDLDPSRPEAAGWRRTNQHATTVEAIRHRHICPDERLLANIDFRPVDMNALPRDLNGAFDFCWSACALEHLGSLAKGADFIINSIKTLKRGGIAVHTTEFNLEDGPTIDNWGTVLFQKQHILDIAARLERMGCIVSPLDFATGDDVLDGFIDIPPWSHPVFDLNSRAHLKLSVDGFICTSVGLIIKKP